MDTSILAPWRDIAIVLLVIEAFIMALVPGAILFFIVKGLRALRRWLRGPLLQAQVWALRIQHGTVRATDAVAAVPISFNSAATQASATARNLIDFILGR
ncbi:MAG: hypothetical protein HY782_22935 [Chloroflexi bacterium]|nr:hypothetical protein [Chloroflexota bacterium]